MTEENKFKHNCRETAEKLITKCQDRSARSTLRQLLTGIPEMEIKAMRHLHDLPFQSSSKQKELRFLVAGLIAEHPCELPEDRSFSFGSSLYQLARDPEVKSIGIERRLESLLELELSSLTQPLHSLILQARKPAISIDYATLLYHLSCWDSPQKWVQLRWASDFWCPKQETPAETQNEVIADEEMALD